MTTGTFFLTVAIVITTGKKRYSRLSCGCAIVITTRKKKDTVICLAGARLLLRPEKKKFQSSVWRVRYRCYNRKIKNFQSYVWRVGDHYYNRKKKVLVVCLAC